MIFRNRLFKIFNKICNNEILSDILVEIAMSTKYSKKGKIIRMSQEYHQYMEDNLIPLRVINRQYTCNILSQYIHSYYFKTVANMSNLRILDVGGGNGDVLVNIGANLNIPKSHLFCLEPNGGWDYQYTNTDKVSYVFWNNKIIPNIVKNASIDVVIIMVTLHHMKEHERNALFTNLHRVTKPGSLLILKEHDAQDRSDILSIEWEHILFSIIRTNVTTLENITEIMNYYEDYRSEDYWDKYICSCGYVGVLSEIIRRIPNKNRYNLDNIYWKVYVKI
jgi:ubiquinone/menaquinone biosynthesis C-methylase UbiE